jgi:hypothetical protein
MGWASGSELLRNVIKAVDPHLDKAWAVQAYSAIIEAFEDTDCDTIEECQGLSKTFDMALKNCGYHVWKDGVCLMDYDNGICLCGFKDY